jgi:Flp pilus assembly protein TadG
VKSEDGHAIVEFALCFMLVVILFCGIVDFGRVFHAYLSLDHAGREAARVASVGGNDAKVREVVKETSRHLNIIDSGIAILPLESNRNRGDYATVTLTYSINFITPVVSKMFTNNQLTLESKTVMRVE